MNKKLRLARIQRHLSELDVCQAIGCDLKTYANWELGKHVPQAFWRGKLCEFFALSLADLGYDPVTLLARSLPSSPSVQRDEIQIVSPSAPVLSQVSLQEGLSVLPTSFGAGSEEIIPALPDTHFSSWETLFPSPLAIILETENDWPAWFAVKQMQILALVSSWHDRATLCHELQLLTDQELKMLDKIKPHSEDDTYFLSRRQALMAIAVYPLALLASFRKSAVSLGSPSFRGNAEFIE